MRMRWLAMAAFLAAGSMARAQTTQPTKLIVHEWGTFTSFAGSDGLFLDYKPLVNGDLPAFVFDREKEMVLLGSRQQRASLSKGVIVTKMRMETPVTYFYTDEPALVDVRVDFPKGLLTEFYPPPVQMAPLVGTDEKTAPIGNSFLNWGRILITPAPWYTAGPTTQPTLIPPTRNDDRYAAARETDSDIIQTTDPFLGKTYQEKFLFYRGVGNFELPLKLRSLGEDHFLLANTSRQKIRAAFLVNIDGGRVRFNHFTNLGGEQQLALPKEESTLDELADAMMRDLIADGLFEKEARAMVATWKTSWFGEDGTRLLYLLPQPMTDEILPLKVQPTPTQTIRVMVGRMETMTPETEVRIGTLIAQLGAEDFPTRDSATKQIRQLGRFAEPALQHVSKKSDDPEVQARAAALLEALRNPK